MDVWVDIIKRNVLIGWTLGWTLFAYFGYIHPPNKDEKKWIDPDFYRLPPPYIPHYRGYNAS